MHTIHTTEGFVIDARPYGEAGKVISVFTQDLGLVNATAQGIRFERSKLRYHVQELSFGMFSFVRGKERWRLTSAESLAADSGYLSDMPRNSAELMARIAAVLKRFLHGEEAHPQLFAIVRACARFLKDHPMSIEGIRGSDSDRVLETGRLKTLESLMMLRIMSALGYVGHDPAFDREAVSPDISVELLDSIADKRAAMNIHINMALRESHL